MSNNMTRSEFLKTMAAGAAAMCLPGSMLAAEKSQKQPNILFLISDDLNDWVGCFGGNPDSKTPNIDRLCNRGVIFERAYCAAPICNPSRASVMMGLRPSTTGVYDNRQPFRLSEIGKNAVTLPQYLRKYGYFATGAGKIYHGKFPDPDSWDTFYPALDKQGGQDPKPPRKPYEGVGKVGIDWGPLDVDDSEMGDYKTVDYCISQLQKKHDKPMFLACGLRKPHLQWYVPRKYFEKYPPENVTLPQIKEDDLDDVPPIGVEFARPKTNAAIQEAGKWREGVAAYLSAIAWADSQVGRLLDALDASEYADNTIIVFWGDHGWHLAEKLHWKKSTLWEEATRAPLMIAAPGITKPGSRCKRTVSFLDMYPTLVELCGLKPKPGLEGHSLVPLLKNPSASREYPAVTTFKYNNHGVRSERWRYIRYSDGTEELYDHDKDEMEWTNLAKDPKYDKVKEEMSRWLPKSNAPDAPHVVWPGDKKGDDTDGE